MLSRRIILALVFLASVTSGAAYAQDKHDGNLWRILSREAKVSYVQGVIDGSAFGVMLAKESLASDDACSANYVPSYQLAFKRELDGVSPSQIVDGVDAIFKDYRNRSLLFTDAIWISLKTIHGLSPEDAEKLLQSVRRLKD